MTSKATALVLACALLGPCAWTREAGAADEKPKAGAKKKPAAPTAPKTDEPKPGPDVDALRKQLESGKEPEILKALEMIRQTGDAALSSLVNELLRRGSTPKACEVALQTAGALKDPSSSESIAPYVQHRSENIRREAARALPKTGGPAAVTALRRGLRSADPAVRGISASGLGNLGARETVGDLMQALDHGVVEAAASIGQLCTPEQCETFAERTGRVGLDVLVAGYDQILFRAPADMPDDEKVRIIVRVRELGTQEAAKFLSDVRSRWPKEWEGKAKQALDAAVTAMSRGGPR